MPHQFEVLLFISWVPCATTDSRADIAARCLYQQRAVVRHGLEMRNPVGALREQAWMHCFFQALIDHFVVMRRSASI